MKVIRVTKRAIAIGERSNGFSCPISVATGRRYFADSRGLFRRGVIWYQYGPLWVPTKQDAYRFRKFINDFDLSIDVKPQSFRMKRPASAK